MSRLSFCVLLAIVAVAASGVHAKGEPTIKETVAREMHHNHDMNEGDFTGDAFFAQHDLNGDKVLDKDEVMLLYNSMASSLNLPQGVDAAPLIKMVWGHVDTDADGRITHEEYTLAMENPPDIGDISGVLKNKPNTAM